MITQAKIYQTITDVFYFNSLVATSVFHLNFFMQAMFWIEIISVSLCKHCAFWFNVEVWEYWLYFWASHCQNSVEKNQNQSRLYDNLIATQK